MRKTLVLVVWLLTFVVVAFGVALATVGGRAIGETLGLILQLLWNGR